MNISSLGSLSTSTFYFLQDQVQDNLIAQQKKITAIAIAIFSVIALLSLAYYCYRGKNKEKEEKEMVPTLTKSDSMSEVKKPVDLTKKGDEILNKARVYFESHDYQREYMQGMNSDQRLKKVDRMVQYVEMWIDDGLLKDPEAYLGCLKTHRGTTEELRMDDHPRKFLFKELLGRDDY